MTYWDPYRAPTDTRALRQALVETRQALADTRRVAERAIDERAAALRALEQAVSERDEALEQAARAEQDARTQEPDPRVARLAADLANVRRVRDEQIARARAEERTAGLLALARVHDDLVRSLEANPDRESPWYQGHAAILNNVRSAIRAAGGSEVGQVGERFDPTVHEAIATAEGPPGTVVAVDRVGLKLDDGTLVRPAQVRVAA